MIVLKRRQMSKQIITIQCGTCYGRGTGGFFWWHFTILPEFSGLTIRILHPSPPNLFLQEKWGIKSMHRQHFKFIRIYNSNYWNPESENPQTQEAYQWLPGTGRREARKVIALRVQGVLLRCWKSFKTKETYCECTKCQWIVQFKLVNCMLCEFHLN